MHRSRFLIASLISLVAPDTRAQSAGTGIRPLSSQQISVENATHPHIESFIAVDPQNAQHLLATAISIVRGENRTYPYVSFDGGKSWTRGRVVGDSSVVTGGDPVIHITRDGTSFFCTLTDRNAVISRSTDGGRTWSSSVILPYADRQWMARDSSRGPFGGRTYFTGTGVFTSRDSGRAVSPFFARSDDDGRTFPFRRIISRDAGGADPHALLSAVPLEPLVTSSGLLLLTLQDGIDDKTLEQLRRDSLDARSIGLIASDDGGESFGPARYAPEHFTSITGSSERRARAIAAFGNVRTALDASSGHNRNRVYFVVSDYDRSIDRYVVRVWRTSNLGKTWATAVASDAPKGDVANPAIAVNRDGVVAVTWNDRRDDPKGRCWQLYAAISTDGGEHFLPSQRLSNSPTCANSPRNWETFGSSFKSDESGRYLAHIQTGAVIPARFPMGGDTQGLAADPTGVFHAAWINGETGVLQLWYTSFGVDPALVAKLRSPAAAVAGDSSESASVPAAMEDVTADIRFHVTNTRLDFAAHEWTITMEIENVSGRVLRGPFRAVMMHFLDERDRGAGLRNLAVANADSGGRGIGATWKFDVQGASLAPGARSQSRILRFSFEGGAPDVPLGYLSPGFRVFASVTTPR
jgi:hypothetical protein